MIPYAPLQLKIRISCKKLISCLKILILNPIWKSCSRKTCNKISLEALGYFPPAASSISWFQITCVVVFMRMPFGFARFQFMTWNVVKVVMMPPQRWSNQIVTAAEIAWLDLLIYLQENLKKKIVQYITNNRKLKIK